MSAFILEFARFGFIYGQILDHAGIMLRIGPFFIAWLMNWPITVTAAFILKALLERSPKGIATVYGVP